MATLEQFVEVCKRNGAHAICSEAYEELGWAWARFHARRLRPVVHLRKGAVSAQYLRVSGRSKTNERARAACEELGGKHEKD